MAHARGWWLGLRGARTGEAFWVGDDVTVEYPRCLTVGDHVGIAAGGYLHCLSERGVHLGNQSSIDRNVWLHCGGTPADHGHGYFELGERSFIGCNAVLGAGGGIVIGTDVLIGQGVSMHAETHRHGDPRRLIREQGLEYLPIVVEDDVWIGSGAIVLGGVTIGRGSVIGAGSVVTADVPPLRVAVGAPARVVGRRDAEAQ
jgi:acetyltransferase-like isoleucine patch superfamily enzyme